MTRPGPAASHGRSRDLALATTAEKWDDALRAASGHLLQSWRWGRFKELHGWRAERIGVDGAGGVGMAQVLFRHRGPVSVAYVPRGPAVGGADPALVQRLIEELDRACRRHRALSLVVEPDRELPLPIEPPDAPFANRPEHIQPGRTVKVPLLDDDGLVAQMHPKMRYNIRLAQRRGVVTQRLEPTDAALSTFYDLLRDTADRNQFGIHGPSYYGDFLRIFGPDAVLIVALIEDVPAAGLIAARFGDEAIYMYGASGTRSRAHGAGFYIQFEAMRWAREQGCLRYDLWGIPEQDPPVTESDVGDRLAGTRGEDWRGLYEYKVRFGGQIVTYPPALERRYHPWLGAVARRLSSFAG